MAGTRHHHLIIILVTLLLSQELVRARSVATSQVATSHVAGYFGAEKDDLDPGLYDPEYDSEYDDFGLDDTDAEDLWLVDFDGGKSQDYKDYLDAMQGDAPSPGGGGGGEIYTPDDDGWLCPPIHDTPGPGQCASSKCLNDGECQRRIDSGRETAGGRIDSGRDSGGVGIDSGRDLGGGKAEYRQKCCYNGCVHTCLNAVPPPPLVDWIKEPPRRLLAGNSWLVGGPEVATPGESCSTDFDAVEEDALLCPHGYICHITHTGGDGIPNRGRCMRTEDNTGSERGQHQFRLATSQQKKYADQNVCVFDNNIFVDGARFMYQTHECECLENSIICTVGKDKLI